MRVVIFCFWLRLRWRLGLGTGNVVELEMRDLVVYGLY